MQNIGVFESYAEVVEHDPELLPGRAHIAFCVVAA